MEISLEEIRSDLKRIEDHYSEPDNWQVAGLSQLKWTLNEIKKVESPLEYINLIRILESLIKKIENSKIGYTQYEKEIEEINKNIQKN